MKRPRFKGDERLKPVRDRLVVQAMTFSNAMAYYSIVHLIEFLIVCFQFPDFFSNRELIETFTSK
jgi:hypothetical protein